MADRPSYAQFQDFDPSQRKHYQAQDALAPGSGIAPVQEAPLVPHTIQRSRIAHDGADAYADPENVLSTTGKEKAAAEGPWQSSYQAACAGQLDIKKKTGKRCSQAPGGGSSVFGGNPILGGGGPPLRPADPISHLTLGTTKNSPHVPGYTGHIPKTATAQDGFATRSNDKSLILENYKPYPGYTGNKR